MDFTRKNGRSNSTLSLVSLQCNFTNAIQKKYNSYSIFFYFRFVIPLVILVVCYVCIFCTIASKFFPNQKSNVRVLQKKGPISNYHVHLNVSKKVEKERAFVIRAPHPSMERWPAESLVSNLRARDQHRQHSPQRHQTIFNRRRNTIFKRAKMKSLYDKSIFLFVAITSHIFFY